MSDIRRYFESRVKVKDNDILAFVPFNSYSDKINDRELGQFREMFHPNCFEFGDYTEIYLDHKGSPLGSVAEGNLKIKQDTTGLKIRYTPREGDEDIFQAVAQGHLDGVSPGFQSIRAEMRKFHNESVRVVYDAKLIEISLTTMPAYFSATTCLPGQQRHKAAKPKDIIYFPIEENNTDWDKRKELYVKPEENQR